MMGLFFELTDLACYRKYMYKIVIATINRDVAMHFENLAVGSIDGEKLKRDD